MGELKCTIYHSLVNRISGIRLATTNTSEKPWEPGAHQGVVLPLRAESPILSVPKGGAWSSAQYGYYETKRMAREESFQAFGRSQRSWHGGFWHYDVISFDVFDTLIFRPFSCPSDLFFFVGIRLGYRNFAQLRREAEGIARKEHLNAPETGR